MRGLRTRRFFADDLERIRKTREGNDRRAVLVVVKNGNVALFFQLTLNLKAPGRGNIL